MVHYGFGSNNNHLLNKQLRGDGYLVGGFNPLENYARQIVKCSPTFGGNIKTYLSCHHLEIKLEPQTTTYKWQRSNWMMIPNLYIKKWLFHNFHGQSAYPHVRYPHDKYSLNKGLLTIVVPLIRPAKIEALFLMGGTSHGGRLTKLTSHEISIHFKLVVLGFPGGCFPATPHLLLPLCSTLLHLKMPYGQIRSLGNECIRKVFHEYPPGN